MNYEYTFDYIDKDDGEKVTLSFSTIHRSVFIDKMCTFMEAIGFGLPARISDDINDLIMERVIDSQDMKRKWDETREINPDLIGS